MILALALAATAPTPGIDLRSVGKGWQVRYTLARPARALHFEIPYADYRQTAWRPEDPAIRIVAEGEAVRAERKDGRPFKSASVWARSRR